MSDKRRCRWAANRLASPVMQRVASGATPQIGLASGRRYDRRSFNPTQLVREFAVTGWRRFVWAVSQLEGRAMGSFFEDLWYRAADAPGNTWQWFNGLNREEWMVVLVDRLRVRLRQLAWLSIAGE